MSRLMMLDNLQPFQAVNLNSDPGHIAGPKIIPACAMVRLNWTLTDGKVAHNVMYVQYNGTPALSAAIAQAVFAALTTGANWTALAAFLAPTTALASVTVLDVRSGTAIEFNSTGSAAPGTSAGTALPDEVAAVVTLRTLVRGPGGRGRMFVPGWASNALGAGNVILAAAVTALNTWASVTLVQAFNNVGPVALGLVHRTGYTSPVTGRVFPDRPAQAVPLISLLVRDNHWDTQRRRGLR